MPKPVKPVKQVRARNPQRMDTMRVPSELLRQLKMQQGRLSRMASPPKAARPKRSAGSK